MDEELRSILADIYEAIRDLRTAHFQTTLTVQAVRAMIQEAPDLERRFAAHFEVLENATDARLFPALIAALDERIRRLCAGESLFPS